MHMFGRDDSKPIYKKWWFWLIVVLIIGGFGSRSGPKQTEQPVKNPTDNIESISINDSVDSKDNANDVVDEKKSLKDSLSDSESLVWFGNVRNDKTGNWRYSMYNSTKSQEELALQYYQAYFESDKEVHALINTRNKTTASIHVVMSGTLDVTIMEYVDKEEHDANNLFGGQLLKEYWIEIATGKIEVIQ